MTPGSAAAIAAGCVCRVIDNFGGRGSSPHMGEPRQFIVEEHCALHGRLSWPNKGDAMRLVIVESPYAGDVAANIAYAKRAIHDCLQRGEAPIASHLLFTQEGILDDTNIDERRLGIEAGLAWYKAAEAIVFYLDRGWSNGMLGARARADILRRPIEHRFLEPTPRIVERGRQP